MNGNSSIQGTVIYDGACSLCHAFMEYSKKNDNKEKLLFVDYQDCDLSSISFGFTPEMADKSIFFIRNDGKRFSGARAVYESLKRLPGFRGILGKAMSFFILCFLSEPFYRVFASNRHYISRKMGFKRLICNETKENS